MNTDPEKRKHSVARRHHQDVLANAGEVVRGLRQEAHTTQCRNVWNVYCADMSHFLSYISWFQSTHSNAESCAYTLILFKITNRLSHNDCESQANCIEGEKLPNEKDSAFYIHVHA